MQGVANINQADFNNNQAFIEEYVSRILAGQITWPALQSMCEGVVAPTVNLFQTVSGLALGTAAAGVGLLGPAGAAVIAAGAVPVIGVVIAGAAILVGIIDDIFSHHAAAVKAEQNAECVGTTAVNNAMAVVMQGVQNGTITAAAAAGSVSRIYQNFMAWLNSTETYGTSPYCNANCEISIQVNAMCLYWQGQYAAQAAQAAAVASEQSAQSAELPQSVGASPTGTAPVSTTVASAFSFSEIPTWAWLVGAGLLAWGVM
jgi:hypothetical protein